MNQALADQVFLALTLWREARSELASARTAVVAVGYVVMTRVRLNGWFGRDTMSVLFKPLQFSSLTARDDPQLRTWPQSGDPAWIECLGIAQDVYENRVPNPVPQADSYYDSSISPPDWATEKGFLKSIGKLNFYRTRTA
jgi:spore germination cell wall hydrolase CwlJ-like protein